MAKKIKQNILLVGNTDRKTRPIKAVIDNSVNVSFQQYKVIDNIDNIGEIIKAIEVLNVNTIVIDTEYIGRHANGIVNDINEIYNDQKKNIIGIVPYEITKGNKKFYEKIGYTDVIFQAEGTNEVQDNMNRMEGILNLYVNK